MKNLFYIICGLAIIFVIGLILFQGPAPMGSMAINRFSVATNSSVVSATTSSFTILEPNSGRLYAYIANEATPTIYLFLGATATANKGIKLDTGESYEIKPENLYVGAVSAISGTTTTSTIMYIEK